jgi:hypothetical protein
MPLWSPDRTIAGNRHRGSCRSGSTTARSALMLTARAPARRRRVVIVGGGFAGLHAARALSRLAKALDVEVVLLNPTDYFLYLPLLPEVAAGILDPRRVSVPLAAALPGVRLLLAAGSVHRLLPIPGVAEHAHGFRSLAEALYLRDHLVRQLELAASCDDPQERAARCTFVVVGAGYTGTEVAAHGQLLTRAAARQRPGLAGQRLRWLLLDLAPRVLPELDPRLGATAGSCASGASRSGCRPRSRPRPATGCSCRMASSCPRARWSGVWGCGPARLSPRWVHRRRAAGWWWTSTWLCPATRSCSRPGMWPPSPTSPGRAGSRR